MVRCGVNRPIGVGAISSLAFGAAVVLAATEAAHANVFAPYRQQDPFYRAPPAFREEMPPRARARALRNRERDASSRAPRKEHTSDPLKGHPGPFHVVVSIDRQRLTLYANGAPVATSPVSTGVPGHATPTGVFSVIQRRRFHHSNIYSGAPMPFMQRITWSGIALHAGIVPGRPASHGCIRLPAAFAQRLWGIAKIGTRVIVTHGEPAIAEFSHPRLLAHKAPPSQAAVAPRVKVAAAESVSTVVTDTPTVEAEKPEGIRGTLAGDEAANPIAPAVSSPALAPAQEAVMTDSAKTLAESGAAGTEANPAEANPAEAKSSDATPVDDAARKTEMATEAKPGTTPEAAPTPVTAGSGDGGVVTTGAIPATPAPAATPAGAPDMRESAVQPSQLEPPAPAAPKDQIAVPEPVIRAEAPVRPGPVSVFISRKEGKLFVRKGFAPVFDAPVTIAPSDRPLGTHVFTAMEYKDGGASLRWTVITVPNTVRKAEQARKGQRKGAPAPAPAPDVASTPSEALERITIPQETMDRIAQWVTPGASLVVSDNGISHETGLETDFVVLTR